MLINSTKNSAENRYIIGAIMLLLLLFFLGVFLAQKNLLFGENATKKSKLNTDQTATLVHSNLYLNDFLSNKKNLIHEDGHFSLYLNQELGAPTLMMVYAPYPKKNAIAGFLLFSI